MPRILKVGLAVIAHENEAQPVSCRLFDALIHVIL